MNKFTKKIFFFALSLSILNNNVNAAFTKKLNRRKQTEKTETPFDSSRIDLTELRNELEPEIKEERFSFLDLPYFIINKILLNLNMSSLIKVALSCEELYNNTVNNDVFLNKYKWKKPSDKSFFILSTNINLKNWEFVNQFLNKPEIKDEHLITHTENPSILVQMIENQAPIELIIKVTEKCKFINIWQNHIEYDENRNLIQTYTPLATLLKNFYQYTEKYFYNTLYFLLKNEEYNNFKEDRTENTHIHLIIKNNSLNSETKLNILRAFYEFNANFNELNTNKQNALHLALENGLDIEIIELLILNGCKVYSNMFNIIPNIPQTYKIDEIIDLLRENFSEDNDLDLIPEEESDSYGDFASF